MSLLVCWKDHVRNQLPPYATLCALFCVVLVAAGPGCASAPSERGERSRSAAPAARDGTTGLLAIAFANSFRPEYQVIGLILSLQPQGKDKPIQVPVTATRIQPRASSEFLVRLDLEPGRYELTRLMGVADSGVTAPQIDIALSMPFALTSGEVHYLGRVAIENVERTDEDDVATGAPGPAPLQDRAGFANGTPLIAAFDAHEQDMQGFRAVWPDLATRAVKSALPPYVRTVSPRGSPVLLREAYFVAADKPIQSQAGAAAAAAPPATLAAPATATVSAATPSTMPAASPASRPRGSPVPMATAPVGPTSAPSSATTPAAALAATRTAAPATAATAAVEATRQAAAPIPARATPVVQSGEFVAPTPLTASAGATLPPEAAQLYQRFLRGAYPRALAVSDSGTAGIAIGGHDTIQRAVADCERKKRVDAPRCKLYAVDDTVVDLSQAAVRQPEPRSAYPQRTRP